MVVNEVRRLREVRTAQTDLHANDAVIDLINQLFSHITGDSDEGYEEFEDTILAICREYQTDYLADYETSV